MSTPINPINDIFDVGDEEIDEYYHKLKNKVEPYGYHLNPDIEFTKSLLRSLIVNQRRYGYESCPCRLAADNKEEDLDIICPCYYRDPDLDDYGACYCALYVSVEVLSGKKELGAIPERRPSPEEREKLSSKPIRESLASSTLPVWRCQVCGYLCAREKPPEVCPICTAEKERFEAFI